MWPLSLGQQCQRYALVVESNITSGTGLAIVLHQTAPNSDAPVQVHFASHHWLQPPSWSGALHAGSAQDRPSKKAPDLSDEEFVRLWSQAKGKCTSCQLKVDRGYPRRSFQSSKMGVQVSTRSHQVAPQNGRWPLALLATPSALRPAGRH